MTMSGIKTKAGGFTLIEVLVAVSILAIGLAGIMEGYRNILAAYGRARLSMEGVSLLEEKMIDQELLLKAGIVSGGGAGGSEGGWNWSTQTETTEVEGFYEIKGEVQGEGRTGTITLYRYVGAQSFLR